MSNSVLVLYRSFTVTRILVCNMTKKKHIASRKVCCDVINSDMDIVSSYNQWIWKASFWTDHYNVFVLTFSAVCSVWEEVLHLSSPLYPPSDGRFCPPGDLWFGNQSYSKVSSCRFCHDDWWTVLHSCSILKLNIVKAEQIYRTAVWLKIRSHTRNHSSSHSVFSCSGESETRCDETFTFTTEFSFSQLLTVISFIVH